MLKLARDILMITVGSLMYALAVTFLAIPNDLADGGIAGLSIILYYAFNWSPGILTFLLTAVILAIGYRAVSKRALGLSLLTIPLVPLFIYLTEGMGDSLGDQLVSAMFAGFFREVGSARIFRTGSLMRGSSTIAIMLEQKYDFDMIRSIFIMDIAIVLSGLIVSGPLHVMYTIVNLFVGKKASDLIMDGLDPRKAVSIVSNQADNIADNIIKTM